VSFSGRRAGVDQEARLRRGLHERELRAEHAIDDEDLDGIACHLSSLGRSAATACPVIPADFVAQHHGLPSVMKFAVPRTFQRSVLERSS
jgi:hypothetical protein